MALPTITVRAATEHHDAIRQVAARLKTEPAFLPALMMALSAEPKTTVAPDPAPADRLAAVERVVTELAARLDAIMYDVSVLRNVRRADDVETTEKPNVTRPNTDSKTDGDRPEPVLQDAPRCETGGAVEVPTASAGADETVGGADGAGEALATGAELTSPPPPAPDTAYLPADRQPGGDLAVLAERVRAAGGQRAVATQIGTNQPMLSRVLAGKVDRPDLLAKVIEVLARG